MIGVMHTRFFRPARLLAAIAAGAALSCGVLPGRDARPQTATEAGRTGSGATNRAEHEQKPHLVLISFDGFRPDYLDRFDLPNFRRVLRRGIRADRMIPVFPSLTFPNHYSLVTGLHAEHHGIVDNAFYDPERRATYSFRDPTTVVDAAWYRGEPIWVTAETQGMVAACYFWPGSEAAIKGVRPTFWTRYDGSVPNDARVNGVLDWLRLPAERRPHLITLYFSELDSVSHRNALNSTAIERAAQSLDRSLGLLLDGIESLSIRDRVYVLLTSDHGMAETSAAQTIQLDSIVDPGLFDVAFAGPVANLHVRRGADPSAIRDRLNARLRHGRAYLRADLPERYHYRADPRAGDIVVVMEESWTLATTPPLTAIVSRRWGNHGWDPSVPSMHALFAISGPDIPAGITIPQVETVDVYHLMTDLLGLRAAEAIDSRPGHIRSLISDHAR
jgi:predicted AlkP superfamily pyrophosphatase or phosphodiesterase